MLQITHGNLLAKQLAGKASTTNVLKLSLLVIGTPEWNLAAHLEWLWKLGVKKTHPYHPGPIFKSQRNQSKDRIAFPEFDSAPETLLHSPINLDRAIVREQHFLQMFSFVPGLFLIAVSFYFLEFPVQALKKNHSEVSTSFDSKTKQVLPDGTTIWLNAESQWTYAEDLGVSNHETYLADDRLVFQDNCFAAAAKKTKRGFDVTITTADIRLAQVRLKGTYEKETVQQDLAPLQITSLSKVKPYCHHTITIH